MNKFGFALGCALFAASSATAQTFVPSPPVPQQAGTAMVVGTPQSAVLRTGTPVPLKLDEELTTKGKKLRVGQRFQMETSADVMLNGHVVIPAGSPAVGQITDVRNKGMWGKSGHLGAEVLYVTANGRQIRLSGAFDDKGTAGGIGATAVSAVVFLPAGFFMTGTSAKVPMGAPVNAFVDEDVAVAFADTPPVPMVVPAQPASATAPASPVQLVNPQASTAPAVATPAVAVKTKS